MPCLGLLSRFEPASAGVGIAVPSVMMFKCSMGGLPELSQMCDTHTVLINGSKDRNSY